MWRRLLQPETTFFLAIWLGLVLLGRSKFFRDPDTFWHTATGQRILDSRQFIDTDPYSFSFAGRPWVAYEWLSECAMAIVHRARGFDGLLLVTTALLAGLYAWLAARLVRCGLHWSLTAVTVVMAVAASSAHFHVRPHILTLVFFGWTFAALAAFEAGRTSLPRLFWLVPLCWLWANVHGGVLGGLGTMALAFLGWTLVRAVGGDSPLRTGRQCAAFAGLGVLCGLVVLLNPYGWRLPLTWWELLRSPVLPRIVREHAPLDPSDLTGLTVLFLGAAYALALAGIWPARPRVTWLLPLAWLGLAVLRVRHAPLFAVAALVALAEFLPHTAWARWLAARGDLFAYPPAGPSPPARGRGLPWLLPATAVLLALASVRGWARLDPAYWPLALQPELDAYARTHPEATPIFNDYAWGGWLIYFHPTLRVFVDGRCEVYGADWLQQYDEARRHHPERIEEWARQYGLGLAMVDAGQNFDAYLRTAPGWREIGRTEVAVLYARKPAAVLP